MKRRFFSQLALTAAAVPRLTPDALAQTPTPQAGRDYRVLKQAVAVDAPPGRIEIVDFFWYSCPHCNAFEPALEAWILKLAPDVVVRRMPVAFRSDFLAQQRLYFTLEAMGKVDQFHGKVFQAIHVQRMALNREDAILDWSRTQEGLDALRFAEVYASFAVANKARRATQIQNEYAVEGVPALGVAGRYYTDGNTARSMAQALQVVDYLIDDVRRSSKASTS